MDFRQSPIITEVTPAADGTFDEYLGTSPISHLVLRLSPQNNGVNTKATLAQILGALTKFEVLDKGDPVISLSGVDLHAASAHILGKEAHQLNEINTDDAVRDVGIIVPFGRKLFNPLECYPARPKGELIIKYTVVIAATGYDALIVHVEQVELPGASPAAHLKMTEKVITQTATGEKDIPLPRGNKYVGLLFYAATIPVNTTRTCTLEYFSLKINNEYKYFIAAYWESLKHGFAHKMAPPMSWAESIHLTNSASVYTQNADSAAAERVASVLDNYVMMDFDPADNDDYLIETLGLGAFDVRPYFGDSGVARCIPIELKAVV